jgi:hypothetical protein
MPALRSTTQFQVGDNLVYRYIYLLGDTLTDFLRKIKACAKRIIRLVLFSLGLLLAGIELGARAGNLL